MFTIPCKIGSSKFEKSLIDLDASINVMPSSIYHSLNMGPLKETNVVIQLADRSVVYPKGVLEDILVQVDKLVFSADFYILDMEEGHSSKSVPILLGRPFLKIARTKIDVAEGTLTMEFDGEKIHFDIYAAMRYPSDIDFIYTNDIVDSLTQQVSYLIEEDELKLAITKSFDPKELDNLEEKFVI